MASEQIPFDVTNIPQLADLAEEVRRDRKSRALNRNGETVAVLAPAPAEPKHPGTEGPARRASRRGKRFTMADPLWDIVGMATSGGPGDVSENKDKYLADAYAAKGE
jgi:hypothetical protein